HPARAEGRALPADRRRAAAARERADLRPGRRHRALRRHQADRRADRRLRARLRGTAMWKALKPAVLLFAVLSVVTGLVYPFVVTGIAQAAFPRQAGGDTSLIGQPIASPRYFWSRPSATSPYPYNAASSSGSNQG